MSMAGEVLKFFDLDRQDFLKNRKDPVSISFS